MNRFPCELIPNLRSKPRKILNTTKLSKSFQAPILEIDNYSGAASPLSSGSIDGYGESDAITTTASAAYDDGYEIDSATPAESVYAPEAAVDNYAAPLDGYGDSNTEISTLSGYGNGYSEGDTGYGTTIEDDFEFNNTDIEVDACFINGVPDPPEPDDLEVESAKDLAHQAEQILKQYHESYSQIPNPNSMIAANLYQAPMLMSHIPPERPQQIIYQMYQQQHQQIFNNYVPRNFRNKRQGGGGGGGGGGSSDTNPQSQSAESDDEDDENHSVKLDACPPPPPSNSNPMSNPVQQQPPQPQPQPPQQPPQQPPPQQQPFTPPPIPTTPIPPPSMQCFSGDTLVKLKNNKIKQLSKLSIDDWILSAGNDKMGYSKVLSWLHRMPEEKAEFLKFTLQNGKYLKITRNHFIFKIQCPSKFLTRENFLVHFQSCARPEIETPRLLNFLPRPRRESDTEISKQDLDIFVFVKIFGI